MCWARIADAMYPDADYGVLEILSLTTDILSMLVGMGIGLAVMRFYYRAADETERRVVVSSAAVLLAAVFFTVSLLGLIAAGPLATLLLGEGASVRLVQLAVLFLAFGSTIEVPMVYLRARQFSTTVVVIGLARLLIAVALNILFVVVMRLGVAGVLYSSIITSILVGGYLSIRVLGETGLHFNLPIIRGLLAFGAPLVVWNVASFVLHFSDRYFLRAFDSLAAVGLYSLSYKLAMLISLMVAGPFSEIWLPKALEIERREGAAGVPILWSIILGFNLVLVTAALGIALFSSDLIRVATGDSFHAAAGPVPLLALAMVFFGYRSITQIGALIRERSDLVAKSSALAAAAIIGMNVLLIPRWGMMGAATATLLAFALEFAIMRAMSRRIYPLTIAMSPLLIPVLLAVSVWAGATLILPPEPPILLSVAIKLIGFIAFGALLAATRSISPEQQRLIWALASRPAETIRTLRGSQRDAS